MKKKNLVSGIILFVTLHVTFRYASFFTGRNKISCKNYTFPAEESKDSVGFTLSTPLIYVSVFFHLCCAYAADKKIHYHIADEDLNLRLGNFPPSLPFSPCPIAYSASFLHIISLVMHECFYG